MQGSVRTGTREGDPWCNHLLDEHFLREAIPCPKDFETGGVGSVADAIDDRRHGRCPRLIRQYHNPRRIAGQFTEEASNQTRVERAAIRYTKGRQRIRLTGRKGQALEGHMKRYHHSRRRRRRGSFERL